MRLSAGRIALLAVLLVLLAALKLAFNPGLGRNSLDGDYYFQIARNVAEGRGLQTDVSLYHQGLKSFPHPINVSPVWPLLLGHAARAIGLWPAALLLPELLYLVDLVLLYLVTLKLTGRDPDRAPLFRGGGIADLGHVAVLLFGLNPIFFQFTSLPYTEALAFLFVFAALLALHRAAATGSAAAALLAGLCAGLAFLTRSQTLALAVAVPVALMGGGLRRRSLGLAALAAAASAAAALLWVVHLASWAEPFHWRLLTGVGSLSETPELEPFQTRVAAGSTWEYLRNRLVGLGVAFHPWGENSYTASFGVAAYLAPLAALLGLTGRSGSASEREGEPGSRAVALASVLAGLGMLVPIHLAHYRFFKEWLFGFRHGLPLLLVLLPALVYLVSSGRRRWRALALLLAAGSLVYGSVEVAKLLQTRFRSGLLGPEPALVRWLDEQSPRPAVVTTIPQPLSVFSRAGFHWIECREDSRQTLRLLDHAGADYVLIYPGEEHCPCFAGLEGELEPVRAFVAGGIGVGVFQRRGGRRE